jgi:polysaccharide deacetylase family protein (PEP-CTERM system associated)
MKSIFSVDVEDWFHILDVKAAPSISEWDELPSRVEKNFMQLLDMFSEKQAHVTCFFLGWVAQRFPHLVREAQQRGHEIASHGYAHRLVYEMSEQEFLEDSTRSRRVLEDITAGPVRGYRSAGFSVTDDTPWYFNALAQAGYTYDSSVFPAPRGHGGLDTGRLSPYVVPTDYGDIIEFPITVARVLGKPVCFFGGGYLRLFPYSLIKRMGARVQGEGRPIIFYIHPREIDPHHPRIPMNAKRTFKSYFNLKTTEPKVNKILSDHSLTTFQQFVEDHQEWWTDRGLTH